MLVEYVKNIRVYYIIILDYTIDTKTQIGTKKVRAKTDEGNRKWTRKRITKTANKN
jgi:hypothetical protein